MREFIETVSRMNAESHNATLLTLAGKRTRCGLFCEAQDDTAQAVSLVRQLRGLGLDVAALYVLGNLEAFSDAFKGENTPPVSLSSTTSPAIPCASDSC